METFTTIIYVIAAVLFVLGLKMLGKTATARKGNLISSVGMLLAILVTLFHQGMDYTFILGGLAVGAVVGVLAAKLIAMTRIPEMVALLNGCGGASSLLVGWAVYIQSPSISPFLALIILLSVLIGGSTFTGSIIAWGKLGEFIHSSAVIYPGQRLINGILVTVLVFAGILFCFNPDSGSSWFYLSLALAAVLGILFVIPIGGADMPVVISLLNSNSGLAAATAGFAIDNKLLIVAGSLVGASGIILTTIMCKAMNRSLVNVLFSGFSAARNSSQGSDVQGEVKPISAEDAFLILESASSVAIVPGYGLAVAQAQHAVHELGELLEENGTEVKYGIHPVAGRMPGHMNVLLAEANVSYDQLFEMDAINPVMESVDIAIVIGANDVVNPAAHEDENSPIYGMPIINVDKAKTVFVLKRSMATGFAGIQNALFFKENTRMLFGDAKATIQSLVAEFKEG
jgi:NAD(P) transhydrogenase subunit beta